MPATGFRNIILAAAAYVEGQTFVGNTQSIQLPSLEMRAADDEQMGLPGVIERYFGIEKMEATLVFNTVDKRILAQLGSHNVREKNFMVRYTTQSNDGTIKSGVVEMSGRARMVERSEITTGEEPTTTTLTITCIAYKETYDGDVVYDIDIEAPKVEVDGTDHWKPIFDAL